MLKEILDLKLSSPFNGIYDLKDGINVFRIYIGGRWRLSEKDEAFDIRTPIDGSVIARAQKATPGDVNLAANSAKAMRGIRELPAIERIEIFNCAAGMLEQHKEEFARVIQLEAGKTNRDAAGEVNATIHRLKLAMEMATFPSEASRIQAWEERASAIASTR